MVATAAWGSSTATPSVSSSSSKVGGNPWVSSKETSRLTKSGCKNSKADTFTETTMGLPDCIQPAASRIACSITQAPSVTM